MNTYRVEVSYYHAEGQSCGHMEITAPSESEAVKSVLDYMQRNMRLYPEYRLHMIKVNKLRTHDGSA